MARVGSLDEQQLSSLVVVGVLSVVCTPMVTVGLAALLALSSKDTLGKDATQRTFSRRASPFCVRVPEHNTREKLLGLNNLPAFWPLVNFRVASTQLERTDVSSDTTSLNSKKINKEGMISINSHYYITQY